MSDEEAKMGGKEEEGEDTEVDVKPTRPPVDLSSLTLSDSWKSKAQAVFTKADVDGSNAIERGEIRGLLTSLNLRLSDELYAKFCEAFFKEADMDHSNTITSDEFLLMFDKVFRPNRLFGAELRRAAGRGQTDKVTELVARGCNPNAGDGKGWNSVHHAAEYGHTETIKAMQELYGADLDIDAEDAVGWTPAFNAASNGNTDVLAHLLECGADTEQVDSTGRSVLHCAANAGQHEAVSALVAAGADVNLADSAGWTPLFCAGVHQHVSTIRALVSAGADIGVKDSLGYTVKKYCTPETIEALEDVLGELEAMPTSPRSPRS